MTYKVRNESNYINCIFSNTKAIRKFKKEHVRDINREERLQT